MTFFANVFSALSIGFAAAVYIYFIFVTYSMWREQVWYWNSEAAKTAFATVASVLWGPMVLFVMPVGALVSLVRDNIFKRV